MISIIIPVKQINNYIYESITRFLTMDYSNFEVIVYPDCVKNEDTLKKDFELNLINNFDNNMHEYQLCMDSRIRFIETGDLSPGKKRDLAIVHAKGEYYAFIDDDAYPRKDWLINALEILKDETIGGVGGPAVTAPNEDIFKIGSGKVYESYLCSGKLKHRYVPDSRRDVDDIPSVNLIVKKDVFIKTGGFNSNYYPGEDTKLCLEIINLGKRIIYDPNTLVYHHRRPLYIKHLRQIEKYAMHRGFFAKKYPQTSLKFIYFVPSLFIIGVLFGPFICALVSKLWCLYFSVIILYFFLTLFSLRSCLHEKKNIAYNFSLLIISFFGIIATHIFYGIFFIKGLLMKSIVK